MICYQRFTQAHLPATVERFLEEIKQKHSAHVFMMVGFPSTTGEPQLTQLVYYSIILFLHLYSILFHSFESQPLAPHKPFSKSYAWKACGFDTSGFENYVTVLFRRWPIILFQPGKHLSGRK